MSNRFLLGFLFTLLAACADEPAPVPVSISVAPVPVVLFGANLVDGSGAPVLSDAVVLIEEDRIVCAGDASDCPVPDGAREIDLSGRWITPGLVDAHVHFSQTAWADGRPDAIPVGPLYPYARVLAEQRTQPERYFRAYLCSGVTAVFDVGGYPWTWSLRELAEHNPYAPHVSAAGPLVSQVIPPALSLPAEKMFISLADSEAGRAAVRYLAANSTDAVKLWFIQPARDMQAEIDARVRAVGEEARRQRVPFIVHATELRQAQTAVEAGARALVHSVEDRLVDQAFIDAMIAADVIYTPTLTVRGGYLRMFDAAFSGEPPEVEDPNQCVDQGTLDKIARSAEVREYLRMDEEQYAAYRARATGKAETLAMNLKTLYEAGVTIAMGTDAGNPLTVPGPSVFAEMEAMQAAGMPAPAVITAATLNGARAMGRAADIGTVENGKVADLLILTADPTADVANFRRLEAVIRDGVYHEQSSLRRNQIRVGQGQ